jgi:glycosyltransferase involved in cell wall biosynthesis
MKILVVHQYYLAPGQPGGSRFNELARFWAEAGHAVTVVAGALNYATGVVPEHLKGKLVAVEHDGLVRVIRCHVPASYGRGFAGRGAAYFGFMLSSTVGALIAGRPDVIVATSPPLTVAITGAVAARVWGRRVPWVFEVRDLWPESAVTTGVLSPTATLTRLLYGLERFACRDADLVNALTPAFREDIVARGLAPETKIAVVPNGADTSLFEPGPRDNAVRRELGWGDRFVVMYAGAHGRANALDQLIDAAELLRDRPDIFIACVGDGPERAGLIAEAQRRGLANIAFHGAQPKERMPEVTNAADVGAAVLQDNPTFRTVYPNKIFDYMACERPVLLAIDGVARHLVCDEARAGRFAQPEDGAGLATSIRELADDPAGRAEMGRRGRAWVVANQAREGLAQRYLGHLVRLATRRGSERAVAGVQEVAE